MNNDQLFTSFSRGMPLDLEVINKLPNSRVLKAIAPFLNNIISQRSDYFQEIVEDEKGLHIKIPIHHWQMMNGQYILDQCWEMIDFQRTVFIGSINNIKDGACVFLTFPLDQELVVPVELV